VPKKRVLLISDVPGWAFCIQMHDLEAKLSGRFDFTHWYVVSWKGVAQNLPDFASFDAVFCLYHRWNLEPHLPWDKTLGTLRAQWLYPETPRSPAESDIALVNRYRAFHFVTQANYDEYYPFCPRSVLLTNPVEVSRFTQTPVTDRVIASWNGNAMHAGKPVVKGFYGIVQPACVRAGVELRFAEFNTCRKAPSEMPEFYRQANLALCASLYEGASSSVMEAMASGLAVLATDVGNHRAMHESMLAHYGESGILLVNRNLRDFTAALAALKADPERVVRMGKLNRAEINRAWSWDVWAEPFARFLSTPWEGE